MSRRIHCIAIIHLDFESIARRNDDEVYRCMVATCRLSKKRIIPRSITWNAYRVSRAPNEITIRLLAAKDAVSEPKEVLRFGFIPPPNFSQLGR